MSASWAAISRNLSAWSARSPASGSWRAENRAAMATSPAAIAPVTAAAPPPPGVGVRAAS